MPKFYTIQSRDVGKSFIRAFGRTWRASDFIGRILDRDVGKRVYEVGGILQVESDAQLQRRLVQRHNNPTDEERRSSRLWGPSSAYGSQRVRKLQSEIADLHHALRRLTTKRERLEDQIRELEPYEGDIEQDLVAEIQAVEDRMDSVLSAIRSARDDLDDLQRELEE